MELTEKVKSILKDIEGSDQALPKALEEAEKLADQFADVKPVPYIVPIERFVGLACKTDRDDGTT